MRADAAVGAEGAFGQVLHIQTVTMPSVRLGSMCWHARRQRKGLVPILVVTSLVMLILTIAIVRAAASARGDERGVICFLSKLGVQIGGGCSSRLPAAAANSAVKQALGQLAEHTPRVKDIELNIPSIGSIGKADGAAAAGGSSVPGLRRLLLLS